MGGHTQDPPDQKPLNTTFNDATESGIWAVRAGAEPIDLHLGRKAFDWGFKVGFAMDEMLEHWGMTAGPGSVFNHNYIEIGRVDGNGEFQVLKRVHAVGLELKNGKWQMTGGGRLVGLVIDGQFNTFEDDDPIQRDDPHATKPNQLQHADYKPKNGEAYTQIICTGSEREILQLYGVLIEATIEMNNYDLDFEMLGQSHPNSNTFNAEMKEKLIQMCAHLNIEVKQHNPGGWDVGSDPDMLHTSYAEPFATRESLDDLRKHIETLEETAAGQWRELQDHGPTADLNTTIPKF